LCLHSFICEREVLVGQNAWQTSKTCRLIEVGEVPQRYVPILDYGPPFVVYELLFGSVGMNSKLQASTIAETSVMQMRDPLEQRAFFAPYPTLASEELPDYSLDASKVKGRLYFVTGLQPGTANSFQIRTASEPVDTVQAGVK
jgi:hypothetical protein